MAKIEDGGPVLPMPRGLDDEWYSGLSLRDHFAGQALAGMLAHGYRPRNLEQHWHEAITEEAYQLADAMLRARAAVGE